MSFGIIYVATGNRCRREAAFSLISLIKSNPSIPITVFTDRTDEFGAFEHPRITYELIFDPHFSYIDKLFGFLNSPYEKTLFIDADTIVVGDLSDLSQLLDYYDFCAIQDPTNPHAHPPQDYTFTVPDSFAEFNTGVVLYRKNEKVIQLFEDWLDLYKRVPSFRTDQDPLREVIYSSTVRTHVLPKNYNFMPGLAAIFEGDIKIFHSPKAIENPDSFIKFINWINSSPKLRMFVPPEQLVFLK